MQGHTGVALGIRVNQQSLWEAGHVVSVKRVGRSSSVPKEKVTVLFKWLCVLQGTETQYSGISRSCIGSLDEVGCSVKELIRGS